MIALSLVTKGVVLPFPLSCLHFVYKTELCLLVYNTSKKQCRFMFHLIGVMSI